MNRKGDLFMMGLCVLFFLALVLIFTKLSSAFDHPQKHEGVGTRQVALLSTYGLGEKMLLYLDTAAQFAAYDALGATVLQGADNAADPVCGKYASYPRWSSEKGLCIPATAATRDAFTKELQKSLSASLQYPGLSTTGYVFTLEEKTGMLIIHATAQDQIELPIVAAKDIAQSSAGVIASRNAQTVSTTTFAPDSTLVNAVLPSPTVSERATDTLLLILPGGTDSAEALTRYTQGRSSVHYLIDSNGAITQLVPEAKAAMPLPDCADCTPKEVNARSIAIAFIGNDLPSGAQNEVLRNLAAEIVREQSLGADKILLQQQVQGIELTKQQAQWREDFLKEAIARANTPATPAETPTTPETTLQVQWPTTSKVVTSCFGVRAISDKFHDGIDMAGEGNDVFAFADGVVQEVCAGECNGFGNNVILKHSDTLYTRYNHMAHLSSLRQGDVIKRGQVLGVIGSTGAATGPHLDFKVYTNANWKQDYGKCAELRKQGKTCVEPGKNALCYFPDDDLRQLTFTGSYCKYGKEPLTHTNPTLQAECQGVAPLKSDTGCFLNTVEVSAGGSVQTTTTTQNINKIPGLMEALQQNAAKEGVPLALVLAIITQESGGDPNRVSPTGCVGLGQFCGSTAKGFPEIFDAPIQTCSCKKPGGHCTDVEAGCPGDPRFDAFKSAQAIPKLLKQYTTPFSGKHDMPFFAIASYNTGPEAIQQAIRKTGNSDPPWNDVSAKLDREIMQNVFCKDPGSNLCSYFDTPQEQDKKIDEVRTYVKRVGGYFTAQGGSTASAFADQTCMGGGDAPVTVKEMGRYWFRPSFTVQVPDVLSELDAVRAFAKHAYETCDGVAQEVTGTCLAQEEQQSSLKFVACSQADDNPVARSFEQFMADCKANTQDMCGCTWIPPKAEKQYEVRLYGDAPYVISGGTPLGTAPVRQPTVRYDGADGIMDATLSLEVYGDELRLVRWEGEAGGEGKEDEPFKKVIANDTVTHFTLAKRDKELVWTGEDVDLCGNYSTQHHVCVQLTKSTYSLESGVPVTPEVRFALYLNDKNPPKDVSGVCVVNAELYGVPLVAYATFMPSTSADISFYNVTCTPIVGGEKLKDKAKSQSILGAKDGVPVTEQQNLALNLVTDCGLAPAEQYEISVVPVDTSGNRGKAAVAVTSDKKDTALVDAFTGGAGSLYTDLAKCSTGQTQ